MIQSDFREWTTDKIDKTFGYSQVFRHELIEKWMSFPYVIDDFEKKYMTIIQDPLIKGVSGWNEVEIENKFISPLFTFARIDTEKYGYFLERELSYTINEYELKGKVDGLIASGFRNPDLPYFCLNEYKKQRDPDGDPEGQVLIAMICAYFLNDQKFPIYGCFVIGILWHFMVFDGKNYSKSKGFLADGDDIYDIFRILKGLKTKIDEHFI